MRPTMHRFGGQRNADAAEVQLLQVDGERRGEGDEDQQAVHRGDHGPGDEQHDGQEVEPIELLGHEHGIEQHEEHADRGDDPVFASAPTMGSGTLVAPDEQQEAEEQRAMTVASSTISQRTGYTFLSLTSG